MAGYIGSKTVKLSTTAANITGNITVGGTVDGRDVAADGVLATNALPKSGGAMTGAITTNSTFDGRDVAADGVLATNALPKNGGAVTGNVTFGDNNKAIFGAGSDLQIYHDGSNSYISDQGTNDLKILATDFQLKNAADNEFMITGVTDGAVTLYHNNAAKIATTATGVDVTGVLGVSVSSASISPDADADNLVIQQAGNAGITVGSATNGVGSIRFADSGSPRSGMIYYNHSGDQMRFYTAATERMSIDSNGLTTASALNVTGQQSGDYLAKLTSTNTFGLKVKTTSTSDSHEQFAVYNGSDAITFKVMGGGTVHASGINLGGSGAANRLDDYEEGTWTPSFADLSNTPSFHGLTGRYTKIGRVVTVQFFAQTNVSPTFGTASSEFKVTGLPFTVTGSGYTGSQGAVNAQSFFYHGSNNTQSVTGSAATGGLYLSASVNDSEQMQFHVTNSGGVRGIVNNAGATQGYIIEATVTYFVTD